MIPFKFIIYSIHKFLLAFQPTKSYSEYRYQTAEGDTTSFKAARLNFEACNPFSQEKVPIYVVDGILPFPDDSDTYMGVPSEVKLDSLFANSVGIPVKTSNNSSSGAEVR